MKLYGDLSNSPKLTEVSTFVGILTEEPYVLWSAKRISQVNAFHFFSLVSPHPDLDSSETSVPTLHVIFYVPEAPSFKQYAFPISESAGLLSPNGEVPDMLQGPVGTPRPEIIRDALVNWIANEALGGDLEAANWVLLAIISRT